MPQIPLKSAAPDNRRRNVFVNPRFQGGIALLFAAVVFVGGALFAWFVYRESRGALWDASMRGHYTFETAYQIVGDRLVRSLAVLFVGIVVASLVVFWVLVHRIRASLLKIVESLRASAAGELSRTTETPGIREIAQFAQRVDGARSTTLEKIGRIRNEARALETAPPDEEKFRTRWNALRDDIARTAP